MVTRQSFAFLSLFLLVNTPNAEAITFSRACERGDSITLAAVGDILLHAPLQIQAYNSPDHHGSLWRGITDLIQGADLAYGNLEGPMAAGVAAGGRAAPDPGMRFDKRVYSGYPAFNFHPVLARDLKRAGFAIVSTANNHSMDRGPIGVDKTIEALRAVSLPFTGTRTRAEVQAAQQVARPWHVVTRKNGWSIAWIACTFSTNGLPDPHRQALGCFRDASLIEAEIRALHASPQIDAVIVTPHWGEVEYTHRVEPSQRALGRRFLEAGAAAIFGNHPHVIKPWEKVVTSDGRETFVIYSIGNFVSNQQGLVRRTSAIIYLGLTKAPGRKAWVNGATYVPLYMKHRPHEVVAIDRSNQVPREALSLLTTHLGSERRIDSRKRITTNPECR
jgi:hypothetical protein